MGLSVLRELSRCEGIVFPVLPHRRIMHSSGLLLTQGRCPGVSLAAALQDPRKEALAFRNLQPVSHAGGVAAR